MLQYIQINKQLAYILSIINNFMRMTGELDYVKQENLQL